MASETAGRTAEPAYGVVWPLGRSGVIPDEYIASSDPNRLVRVFPWPERIGIVVAGDPGRNQVKGYTSNHRQGLPVSKEVRVPNVHARI